MKMSTVFTSFKFPSSDMLGDEGRNALDAVVKVELADSSIDQWWSCAAFGGHPLQTEDRYSIFDIYEAVSYFDKAICVRKHPMECVFNNKTKEIIILRDGIEREYEEAKSMAKKPKEYRLVEAEHRVKGCYAGHFPNETEIFTSKVDENGKEQTKTYNIFDIRQAVQQFDKKKLIQKYPEDKGPKSDEVKKLIEKHNFEVNEEYTEAKRRLPRYIHSEAERKVRECFQDLLQGEVVIFPIEENENGVASVNQSPDILDILKRVIHFEECKYKNSSRIPFEVTHSFQVKKDELKKEYLAAVNGLPIYSRDEAEHRLKDCFAATFPAHVDLFLTGKDKHGIPKSHQTTKNFECKETCVCFDEKQDHYNLFKKVVEQRGNGSGFIFQDHFVITSCKFGDERVLCGQNRKIHISNAVIGTLSCEVAFVDVVKDLALLYCQDLKLDQNGIKPLQLSDFPLSTDRRQTVSFGYPRPYPSERAFVIDALVCGSIETPQGYTLMALQAPLDPGFCGSPILYKVNGNWSVVGVVRTKEAFGEHISFDEQKIFEKLCDSSIHCTYEHNQASPLDDLAFKLFDVLAAHQHSNLYVLPGKYVIEFISKGIGDFLAEGKDSVPEAV